MLAALRGLRGYAEAAEEMAVEMAQENGVATAAAVIEAASLA